MRSSSVSQRTWLYEFQPLSKEREGRVDKQKMQLIDLVTRVRAAATLVSGQT